MNKVFPAFLAVAALMVAAPAPGFATQDAAPTSAQAGDPEAAANELYKNWKAEADPAKKAALAKQAITQHFGSKAAEAIAYAGMFTPNTPNDQILETSRAYYEGAKASGKDGQYLEYALGNLATREKDPAKVMQYGEEYMQKYPTGGKFDEYVRKNLAAVRYTLFKAALDAKKYSEATHYADEAFTEGQNDFVYAYLLTTAALVDISAQGAKSQLIGQAGNWADRVVKFVESGKMPAGGEAAKWEKDKPATLAVAYKTQGIVKFFQTAQGNPPAPEAYDAAIELLKKSASHFEKDPITHYYISQARNAQYGLLLNRYNALTPEQQGADEGKVVLDKVNAAADELINSYIKVLAYAGENQALKSTIEPPLAEVYKYRHPDTPEQWRDEVRKVNAGTTASVT